MEEREVEVTREMNVLDSWVSGIERASDELLKRLDVVMRSGEVAPDKGDKGRGSKTLSAPLANTLSCLNERLRLVSEKLNETTNRLEI